MKDKSAGSAAVHEDAQLIGTPHGGPPLHEDAAERLPLEYILEALRDLEDTLKPVRSLGPLMTEAVVARLAELAAALAAHVQGLEGRVRRLGTWHDGSPVSRLTDSTLNEQLREELDRHARAMAALAQLPSTPVASSAAVAT